MLTHVSIVCGMLASVNLVNINTLALIITRIINTDQKITMAPGKSPRSSIVGIDKVQVILRPVYCVELLCNYSTTAENATAYKAYVAYSTRTTNRCFSTTMNSVVLTTYVGRLYVCSLCLIIIIYIRHL